MDSTDQDAANVAHTKAAASNLDANSIKCLTDAGFTPTSVVAAVHGRDVSVLNHTGEAAVQLPTTED